MNHVSYNWKVALRKAVIQALLALFTQFASMQCWPSVDQLWIPLALAGLAFFTVLEKEEPGELVSKNSNVKKVKQFISESLLG